MKNPQAVEAMEKGSKEDYQGAMRRAAEVLVMQSENRHVQPTIIARLFVDAEEKNLALDWLDEAFQEHNPVLVHLVGLDWYFLRPEPRFQDLLRRMKLPPYPP